MSSDDECEKSKQQWRKRVQQKRNPRTEKVWLRARRRLAKKLLR